MRAAIFLEVLSINETQINEEIRVKEVRVISETGEQMGIMATAAAIAIAEQKNLDLCLISPTANPPVCKIMDYGKYRFEMQKREKDARKNQRIVTLHEIQLSVTIEQHDLAVKAKKAREFLEEDGRIKVSIRFRSRQIAHPEKGQAVMNDFFKSLADIAKVERPARLEGRNMIMILVPLKST